MTLFFGFVNIEKALFRPNGFLHVFFKSYSLRRFRCVFVCACVCVRVCVCVCVFVFVCMYVYSVETEPEATTQHPPVRGAGFPVLTGQGDPKTPPGYPLVRGSQDPGGDCEAGQDRGGPGLERQTAETNSRQQSARI